MEKPTTDEADILAATISSHVKVIITTEFPKLLEVWGELWDRTELQKRKEMLDTHFTDTFSTMFEEIIAKELQTKEEYIARVEKLLDEIGKLEIDLNVKIPYDDVETLPLHCMAKRLNQKAERYRVMLEERLNKLKDLRSQEASLMEALGTVPAELQLPAVPSQEELEGLMHHVQAMEVEKRNRMMLFMEKRQRIQDIFKLLGSKPSLHFEKNVVEDERATEFKVTNENMAHLDELLVRLEGELNNALERREDLVRSLLSMWDYLEEPKERQEQLVKQYPGCTPADVAGLQAELERCKKEKSANIQKFVERVRCALVAEWDRCLVSEETRRQFRVFTISYFNEDIYDLHELELARWKTFYSENQRIFELNTQHTALFEKLLDLNGRGKSVKRYHNRGGQLLQEERQRKVVAKDLPRVEGELRSLLATFEEKHGEPFTAFGKPLVTVLDEKWTENFDQKTIDKFRGLNLSLNGRTPLAVKRPAAASSSTGAKVSRLAEPNTVTRGKRCLYRVDTNTEQVEPDSTIQLERTYEDFQKKLGVNKLVTRSTERLTPGKLLRERNAAGLVSTRSSPAINNLVKHKALTTPKTVPRRNRATPMAPRTPLARNRLPIIL